MSNLQNVTVSADEKRLLDIVREARKAVDKYPKDRKEKFLIVLIRPKSPVTTIRAN